MTSYAAGLQQAPVKNQISVLAQAKPAIISTSTNGSGNANTHSTGILSEKINTVLRLSQANSQHSRDFGEQKVKFIEDDNVIHKQNASNQMRQAAVMAAAASQQKVRLSATERLAMTATRPPATSSTRPQPPAKQPMLQQHQQLQLQQQQQQKPQSQKPAPMPTLETLLAVQRQLQQHTRQNLTSVPREFVTEKQQPKSQPVMFTNVEQKPQTPQVPEHLPALTNTQVNQFKDVNNHVTSLDAYEKDLPPLPASVSPSTLTDDSQLNSLESQSSPATSLVSIPPPPPPISSYLQQYDEVNNSCHQSSTSSTPTTTCSSEVSSVRHFPQVPVKPILLQSCHNAPTNFDPPPPSFGKVHSPIPEQKYKPSPPPPPVSTTRPMVKELKSYPFEANNNNLQQPNLINNQQTNNLAQPSTPPKPQQKYSPPPLLHQNSNALANHKPQINYQQHVFTNGDNTNHQCNRQPFVSSLPPPPPPPLPSNDTVDSSGFDEPDSGNFRFPTPPPPHMLLDDQGEKDDEDEDDDDFQCKIPTPPPHKSISSATFQDFHNNFQQQQLHSTICSKRSPPPVFSSSTFSVPPLSTNCNGLQPPPLFRQHQQQQQQQQRQQQHQQSQQKPDSQPQLTVHINHEAGGLLATSNHNKSLNHHMMIAMTASSSSPSSSSDGDGHSSNSSSSTSGIHSSIDSPSSSNSKLDDFNYSGASSNNKLKHRTTTASPLISSALAKVASNHELSALKKSLSSSATANTVTNVVSASSGSRRPTQKYKKTVSFSDKVELVACADEQREERLPNPLLARVLAGKLQ